MFLHNDPYLGASHAPDLCVAIPIFHDGRLCAWSCANGHLADVGGMSPGLMVHPVDVWAEGHHYTALRIEDRGERNQELWKHIWANTRTPTLNSGDTEALIAASRLGRARFLELIDDYGYDTVFAAGEYWLDYSERKLRPGSGGALMGARRAARPVVGRGRRASLGAVRRRGRDEIAGEHLEGRPDQLKRAGGG